MADDRQLLHRFAEERSEAAFGELVTRHLPLVYSTAIRQAGGDEHLAKDVAQVVFTDFARKAPSLSKDVILAGWLHRATIFAARQILRGDRRRREREQQAVTMNAPSSDTENDWQQIRPLLDEALDRLSKADRDALLLRFFEQQSFAPAFSFSRSQTMTPYRGIGANVALKDAMGLARALTAAQRGERDLMEALRKYEAGMLDYGFRARSRRCTRRSTRARSAC